VSSARTLSVAPVGVFNQIQSQYFTPRSAAS
jgi:hypothetical protein